MCGGEGKRLWPLSRRSLPKYYIPLSDGESLFQKAFRRALLTSDVDDILLVTTEVNKHNALKQARAIVPNFLSENLIIRPEGKETFATLACALGVMIDRGAKSSDVLICAPADHVINEEQEYKKTLDYAVSICDKMLTVIGIQPTSPSSDFGYIEYSNHNPTDKHSNVIRFTEKPERQQAEIFISRGNFLWNAGFYIGTLGVYLNEIEKIDRPTAYVIEGGIESIWRKFEQLPEKSIDYVISEKAEKMQVVKATFDWNDYGDLESFIKARGKEEKQVVFEGENVTVSAEGKLVVSVGLSDIAIVHTRDALLVAQKSKLGNLSKVVNSLKEQELSAVDHHYTGYRPWGTFEVIEEAPGYNVKKIVIDPGCSSSVQTHEKRSEHWVIVSGVARVTLNDETITLRTNDSLHIPALSKHSIENPMTGPLVLIEVQTGSYIEEDDIKREKDPYLKEHITKFP